MTQLHQYGFLQNEMFYKSLEMILLIRNQGMRTYVISIAVEWKGYRFGSQMFESIFSVAY